MKSGIHPDYHEINVIMADGTEYKTKSCYGEPGATLRLDVDPKTHPAWTGVQRILDTGARLLNLTNASPASAISKSNIVSRRFFYDACNPSRSLKNGEGFPYLGYE